ncbi:MAG: histidine kinase [Betaproteobacteria bacterium]|nr:histidine kinase [Betaproteobacteria bacterium]
MSAFSLPTPSPEEVTAARREPFHPLEIIPLFRRWPYSFARDLLYTAIWNALIGLAFSLIGAMMWGKISLRAMMFHQIFSQCIGFTIHALFIVGGLTVENWVIRQRRLVIVAYYSTVATVGVIIGWIVASGLVDYDIARIVQRPSWLIGIAINSVIISLIILAIYTARERKILEEMALEKERARFAEVEKSATLANLRMLQAQIEPHFLFNTLANVTSLIHPAPDTAKQMLESFITYLRGSLAASREETTTLAREFKLMRDFLGILKIRMGERLQVEIDLPDDLADLPVPPMLIQPLVENAIKHGLEPKMEGGLLTLQAHKDGANIRIVIADTGLGFSGATSSGVGLRNVRERIKALFGDAGKLSIEENAGGGTRVVVMLPMHEVAG